MKEGVDITKLKKSALQQYAKELECRLHDAEMVNGALLSREYKILELKKEIDSLRYRLSYTCKTFTC